MVTTAAALSPATMATATVTSSKRRKKNVNYITGLNSFGGLKAQNNVTTLGLPVSTELSFAKIVNSLRKPSRNKRGGGAMSSTCSAIAEIFRIAAIMPGLVLVGVAVGFVLLRIESSLEEAE